MDTRRVHRVGSNSLAVTLPSSWAREVGLEPGGAVSFLEGEGSSLVVVPAGKEPKSLRSAVLKVEADASPGRLARLLIGSYVVGFESIEVRAPTPFSPQQLEALRGTVSRLTGLAVVESQANAFLVRSYLDRTWSGLGEHLHRLLALTETMVAKAPALISRDLAAAREVLELGEQSDRLYYLTVRSLLSALSDPSLRIRMGLNAPQEVVGCRLIAKALEEVGDSLETLADVVLHTEGVDLDLPTELTEEVAAFTRLICGHLTDGVDGFLEGSPDKAEAILQKIYEMEHAKHDLLREILKRSRSPFGAAFLTVTAMVLRDVCRFARVIGEVGLNNAIRCRAGAPAASEGRLERVPEASTQLSASPRPKPPIRSPPHRGAKAPQPPTA